MRLAFYATLAKQREENLANAFVAGAKRHGIDAVVRSKAAASVNDADVAVVFGIKGSGVIEQFREAGKRALLIDKGFTRDTGHYKVCWGMSPLRYFMRGTRDTRRLNKLPLDLKPLRSHGENVVYAGSSQKYCTVNRLGDATSYANVIIDAVRAQSQRPIIYRPKPSWAEARPINGTTFSRPPRSLQDELHNAHCLITHGSNAAVEAVIAGIPAIVLGDGVAAPVCRRDLENIEQLFFPSENERWQWLSNLSYCQFTLDEMHNGTAWEILEESYE